MLDLSSEIGAVFAAFVFEPELKPRSSSEPDRQAGRLRERERVKQDVEVSASRARLYGGRYRDFECL
jgi:hypothetical protein